MTAQYKCEDCKDTGEILTECVRLSEPFYSKEHKGIAYETTGLGNWHKSQCYCVGEDE